MYTTCMISFQSATCPNCQTFYDRLPVDGDEDGNVWVVLESKPCGTCGQMLCPCCEQFVCEHGETHCIEHLTVLDPESKHPLKCCPACLAEAREQEVAAAAMCPDCGSVELVGETFHGSMDRETGYTECQELYRCLTCGSRGPSEEVIEQPVPNKKEAQRETAPAIAAKAGVA
jgi:hypothetical protein